MSTRVGYIKMELTDFLAYPPVFCQRREEFHYPKILKYIKETNNPTVDEVALFEYPNGKRVVGNGNTRAYIWRNGRVLKVPMECIPSHVQVSLYQVESDEDAKNLYSSFDNQNATETKSHVYQGAFRAAGMKLHSKFKLGKGVSAFNTALQNYPEKVSSSDPFQVVQCFKNEIEILDKLCWAGSTMPTAFVASGLMALKRYGTDNARLIHGLNLLVSNTGGGTISKCPIDRILAIWQGGGKVILRDGGEKIMIETSGNGGTVLPRQMDVILYALGRYMKHETIEKFTNWKGTYENYWNYLKEGK